MRLGLGLGLGANRGAFSPLSLFANNEPGWLYDISDLSTLFQDAAGTTPAVVGQPVGLVRDKSGRGNHATAAGTKRPTLGRHPTSGIRNLYTNTGFAGGATGAPGIAPTGWAIGFGTGSISAITADATLGGNSVTLSATAARQFLHQQFSPAVGTTWTLSADVVLSQTTQLDMLAAFASQPADATLTFYLNGVQLSNLAQVPAGAHRVSVKIILTATAGTNVQARLGIGCAGLATGTVKVSNPQLEAGAVATNYQLVRTAFDIQEVPFADCYYLGFDGADDAMSTGAITPGTDKVQVFAGVQKLSDAAQGVVAELTNGVTNRFSLYAPPSGLKGYVAASGGSTVVFTPGSTEPAPHTAVLSLIGDISGDLAQLRINSSTIRQTTTDQGTGDYASSIVYFGGRATTSLFFKGRTYAIVGRFGPNLTAGQIAQVEAWINSRTGAF